ncbi:hypothetical protein Poli38472_010904 [Pythium oligandrum]|uniref:Serine protease n=1 Tax=Pythium oligandrum TaxID=41045 RepID=A0A8K1CFE3_PYTOL|nr:hypothetical protein Poli38472_010904 [Pythium oligandrum]|eukprot:TMW61841.1 hypothetical protein Poli38472_010904 [Pythium oligandrum]
MRLYSALVCASALAVAHGLDSPIGAAENRTFAVDASVAREPVSEVFSVNGSSFITVHFAQFKLGDGDAVRVRSPDGETVFEYSGLGRGDLGTSGGFFSSKIPGDTAIVEYLPSEDADLSDDYGFTVDKITRTAKATYSRSICGNDDSKPVKCYNDKAGMYGASKAVARLMVNGAMSCTGWLVGSEGHLMSNFHCLGLKQQVRNTDFEFLAESASCDDECKERGGCAGTVVAESAEIVASDETLDYALVKLNTIADLSAYGYLKLRVAGATENEKIYVPQHPTGWAKRIAAVVDDGSEATITQIDGSSGCGDHRIHYTADTEGGSSGSPIIAVSDNAVVALHSCGLAGDDCENTAADIRSIIWDIKNKGVKLPKDALDDPNAEIPQGPWIPAGASTAPAPSTTTPPAKAATPSPTESICGIFKDEAMCATAPNGLCTWKDSACVSSSGSTPTTTEPAPGTVAPDADDDFLTEAPTPVPTPSPVPSTSAPSPTPAPPATTTPAPTTPASPVQWACKLLWTEGLCQSLSFGKCSWKDGVCK